MRRGLRCSCRRTWALGPALFAPLMALTAEAMPHRRSPTSIRESPVLKDRQPADASRRVQRRSNSTTLVILNIKQQECIYEPQHGDCHEFGRVLQGYTSQDAILKYTKATAGYGIGYLLDHDYKAIYLEALSAVPPETKRGGIRILEFGCGGGMNLVHLMSVFERGAVGVETAVGTDFSPVLIEAARREAKNYLNERNSQKISFHVAKNETLVEDLVASMAVEKEALKNSFHFILGVNTIRYCHRAKKQVECARDVFDMLAPGGVCVVIDMNDRFPLFRSALKSRFGGRSEALEECYIPSLSEYTDPFESVGFEVLNSEHFCWIPHSAGEPLSRVLAVLTPVLNTVARSRAMRSLVVARKPISQGRQ